MLWFKKIALAVLATVSTASLATMAVATSNEWMRSKADNTPAGAYFRVTDINQMQDDCGDAGSKYLIVYKEGKIAFNGNLTTLDAVSNTVPITIDKNDLIANTSELEAAQFTIDRANNTIQSSSGYYIGRIKDDNGLDSNTETTYTHTISFTDGDVHIESSSAVLRYNAISNQKRFRYYKSTSYTNQQAIQLYKLQRDLIASGEEAPTITSPATLTFTTACDGSGIDSNGNTWTITSDAAESIYDNTKGIHYGTNNVAVSYLNLSTSGINGTITEIIVNASGASGTSAKLNITVGNNAFGSQQSLTTAATEYKLTGSASGEIVVNITQSSAKRALYCKSITVYFE